MSGYACWKAPPAWHASSTPDHHAVPQFRINHTASTTIVEQRRGRRRPGEQALTEQPANWIEVAVSSQVHLGNLAGRQMIRAARPAWWSIHVAESSRLLRVPIQRACPNRRVIHDASRCCHSRFGDHLVRGLHDGLSWPPAEQFTGRPRHALAHLRHQNWGHVAVRPWTNGRSIRAWRSTSILRRRVPSEPASINRGKVASLGRGTRYRTA